MNKVSGIDGQTLLRTADLAAREEFQLGQAHIIPGTRTIRGPGGEADLEPRVMQVLIVLADSAGTVVTRETLFQRCWGNVFVGDDSLNRAVAGVRKVAENIAAGSFVVETVPRTGYQLIVKSGVRDTSNVGAPAPSLSRRRALVAGSAAVLVAGGAGTWAVRSRLDPRFVDLMQMGEKSLLSGDYENPEVIALYRRAVSIEPGQAKAWGLLAYFCCTVREEADAKESARLADEANQAIRRALAIEPDEPNARMALLLLEGPMLDWGERDQRIREISSTNGNNIPALKELMHLTQAAGLTRESWDLNERILALAPLSSPHLVYRSMKLWILGRPSEADKVIDRVRGIWPEDIFAYFVRLMLFALTDRPRAGLAMLDSEPDRIKSTDRVNQWRIALRALEERSPKTIEAARLSFFEAAAKQPWGVNLSVMILSKLGETDAAFELADGYLLWRGKLVSSNSSDAKVLNDFNRRMTPWLFTPPVAEMRADPRFLRLCEEFGLAAYWRARGVKPDYMTA